MIRWSTNRVTLTQEAATPPPEVLALLITSISAYPGRTTRGLIWLCGCQIAAVIGAHPLMLPYMIAIGTNAAMRLAWLTVIDLERCP